MKMVKFLQQNNISQNTILSFKHFDILSSLTPYYDYVNRMSYKLYFANQPTNHILFITFKILFVL